MCVTCIENQTKKKKKEKNIKPKYKVMVSSGGLTRMRVDTEEEHMQDSKSMGNMLFLNVVERYPGTCFIKLCICPFVCIIIII